MPPGTPLSDVSFPYDPYTNDSGNTSPYPGDRNTAPQNDCDSVRIYFRYTRLLDGITSTQELNVLGRAPVESAYISEVNSGGSSIFVVDKGVSGACPPATSPRRVDRGLGTWSNLQWYSVKV